MDKKNQIGSLTEFDPFGGRQSIVVMIFVLFRQVMAMIILVIRVGHQPPRGFETMRHRL